MSVLFFGATSSDRHCQCREKCRNVKSDTFPTLFAADGRWALHVSASVKKKVPSQGSALLGAFPKVGAKFSGYRQVLGPGLPQLKTSGKPFCQPVEGNMSIFLCAGNKIQQNATCWKFFKLPAFQLPSTYILLPPNDNIMCVQFYVIQYNIL